MTVPAPVTRKPVVAHRNRDADHRNGFSPLIQIDMR